MRRPSLVLPTTATASGLRHEPGALLDLAAEVDASGAWEALAVPDSVLALPFVDSVAYLGALAARTSRVRVGWAALASLALRDPLVLAHQWASLDRLSGGRTFCALAPGNRTGTHHVREREAFGLDFDERLARTLDGARFLRAVRGGGPVTYRSEWLDVADLELRPGFVQERAPLWFTANPSLGASDEGVARLLRRVVELGDGWLTHSTPPDVLARRVATLRTLLDEAGHDGPFPVVVHVNLFLDRDDARARTLGEPVWREQASRGLTWDEALAAGAIGDPERVADLVAAYAEAGATDLLLNPLGPDPRAQVRAATDDLLPLLPEPEDLP